MSRFKSLMVLVTMGIGAIPALADMTPPLPPPPGSDERRAAMIITQAGFRCPEVVAFAQLDTKIQAEYEHRRLNAVMASCSNGTKYLVARPQRRWPGPPIFNESAAAQPVVQQLK